jgi:UDP-N-acetylglucosamine--dolichyl-phosphate N-acetylglucosaminephosphotransferase
MQILHYIYELLEQKDPKTLISISLLYSIIALIATWIIIPRVKNLFIEANLSGNDAHRKDKPLLAEGLGIICGLVYIITLFMFIPIPFLSYLKEDEIGSFPHHNVSIFCQN